MAWITTIRLIGVIFIGITLMWFLVVVLIRFVVMTLVLVILGSILIRLLLTMAKSSLRRTTLQLYAVYEGHRLRLNFIKEARLVAKGTEEGALVAAANIFPKK